MRRAGVGIARRAGLRGLGAGAVIPTISVVANISGVNTFSTTDAARPSLSTTSTIAVVLRKITSGNLAREWRIQRWTSNTRGFQFMPMHDGTTARANALMVSSAPANVSEGVVSFSPTQNAFQVMVMRRTSTTIEVYRNGSLTSTGTAITGYTTPTSEAFLIGTNSAVTTDEVEIASISISDSTALTAQQIADYQTTVAALGSRVIPDATHHWEASDIGAAWVDRIAGVSLTKNGGGQVVRVVEDPVFQ
jgi:hypothetical protein